MKRNSLVYYTRQWWKLKLSFFVLLLSGIGLFLGLFLMVHNELFFWVVVGSICLGIITLAWACLTIVCPVCKTHWVWFTMKSKGEMGSFSWLVSSKTCPVCHNEFGSATNIAD